MMKKNILLKILIWTISFTWGFFTSICGLFYFLFLIISGEKPKKLGPIIKFEITEDYGVSFGPFVILPKYSDRSIRDHELGHCLQNCLLGPVAIFTIFIPSIIRFWIREQTKYEKKQNIGKIIYLGLFGVGIVLIFASLFSKIICLLIIGLFLVAYSLLIGYWLIFKELPQYAKRPYPAYDDIWFEHDASIRGTSFMDKYYPEDRENIW
jgi:hypothetical protein